MHSTKTLTLLVLKYLPVQYMQQNIKLELQLKTLYEDGHFVMLPMDFLEAVLKFRVGCSPVANLAVPDSA